MAGRRSNSSIPGVGLVRRIGYLFGLLRLYLARGDGEEDFSGLRAAIDEYRTMAETYGTTPLERARVLEIGFGARPLRLMALYAMGIDVTGVDIDKPIVRGTPCEFVAIWRRNGFERALKSLVRFWINDRRERRELLRVFGGTSGAGDLPVNRMIVASAGDPAFWQALDGKFDLIVSEDVFEHIPRAELETVIAQMHAALAPGGIALIRPMIYSGISGGHHLEWYPHMVDRDVERPTEPWEHLRRNRRPADTYLNGMLRRDYRELFGRHFDIRLEKELQPGLGRRLLTPEIRAELADYPEEELLSNNVLFVLTSKPPEAVPQN